MSKHLMLRRRFATVALFLVPAGCSSHADRAVDAVKEARKSQELKDAHDHNAGFAFGKKTGAATSADCLGGGSFSVSFIQGCEAYVASVVQSAKGTGTDQDNSNFAELTR